MVIFHSSVTFSMRYILWLRILPWTLQRRDFCPDALVDVSGYPGYPRINRFWLVVEPCRTLLGRPQPLIYCQSMKPSDPKLPARSLVIQIIHSLNHQSICWNSHLAVCQTLVPLVNIKIAGKWMFIPLKMVLIGIDPYPCLECSNPKCLLFVLGWERGIPRWILIILKTSVRDQNPWNHQRKFRTLPLFCCLYCF